MGEEIRKKLGEEILRLFEQVRTMKDGPELEKARAFLNQLLQIQNKEETMEFEAESAYWKQDTQEAERKAKEIDTIINRAIQVLGIVGPLAGTLVMAYIWRESFREGLFFEETGFTKSTFCRENFRHFPKI